MYLAQISFNSRKQFEREVVEDIIYSFLASLRMNGQILGEEISIIANSNGYIAYEKLPLVNSLDAINANKYVISDIEKLNEVGIDFSVNLIGEQLESSPVCECINWDSLILFTNYLSIESPLRCGKCFGFVPLYLIPHTYDEDYHDIISWQTDYKACDRLQMGCATGERFGTREITKVNSSLTRRGLEICDRITTLLKIPTYYYLYRYNDRSRIFEEKRKCPSCNGEWMLDEPLHGLFDFKCDKCHLLSNISWSSR